MSITVGRIGRTGVVSFGDASLAVWEEGISAARDARGYEGAQAWELQFKRDVFARIVQMLNRLGWTCTMPAISEHDVKHYGGNVVRWSAERKRFCVKGDLKADLSISGRCIEFNMFQSVNCPTRPDHEGRYEWNKTACMPYVVRLEMNRTRNRIRDYLCNVFEGYTFEAKSRSICRRPGLVQPTAIEELARRYAESSHFNGVDWEDYLERNHGLPYNRTSKDNATLEHGQRVWFADLMSGRIHEGNAFYNINNMWWVVTGRYDLTNVAAFDLYTRPPENIRVKRNGDNRRKRLESLLADATRRMDFARATVLRDILFPSGPVFHIRVKKDGLLFGPNYRGYTHDSVSAGRYTRDELKPYLGDKLENAKLQAVQIRDGASEVPA